MKGKKRHATKKQNKKQDYRRENRIMQKYLQKSKRPDVLQKRKQSPYLHLQQRKDCASAHALCLLPDRHNFCR